MKINGGKLLGHSDKKFNRAMRTDSTIWDDGQVDLLEICKWVIQL